MNDNHPQHAAARAILPTLLHESSDWFVLNKPVGWHSVAARVTDGAPTIQEWISENLASQRDLPESGLVHRLDHSTSGCLLVARSALAQDGLRENFSAGFGGWAIGKKYLALVTGGIAPTGEFTLYFSSRHKGSAKVTVNEVGDRNEVGTCRWRVRRARDRRADAADPGAFDLIEVELVGPGRRHQIRAGLASLGHPLASDTLYRGAELRAEWNLSFAVLHAWKLVISGVEVISPSPRWADWER